MIVRNSVALVALLAPAVGACSDGGASAVSTTSTSSPSSTSSSTHDTLVVQLPTLLPTSTPSTAPVAPAVPSPATTRVLPTSTPPPASSDTSAPIQTSTDSSVPSPASGAAMLDVDCTSGRADPSFDLLHVTVESLASQYRLRARYSGDTFRHDVVVSFDLGASIYVVTAELFEDGTGVARVSGTDSSDDVFLDPPQTITPGVVDVTVRNDQIDGLSGTPFNVRVSLKVDGSEIETCQ